MTRRRKPLGYDGKYRHEVYAELIFDHIPAGDDATPISRQELAEATGIGIVQVSEGIAYLRDHHPDFPLVSGHSGYRFTDDYVETHSYLQWRAQHAQTGMRRMVNGAILPYLRQHRTDPVRAKVIERSLVRLLEDMDELIAIDPPAGDEASIDREPSLS